MLKIYWFQGAEFIGAQCEICQMFSANVYVASEMEFKWAHDSGGP